MQLYAIVTLWVLGAPLAVVVAAEDVDTYMRLHKIKSLFVRRFAAFWICALWPIWTALGVIQMAYYFVTGKD
jgi:hypothetical protein